jgi:hypothetical protein
LLALIIAEAQSLEYRNGNTGSSNSQVNTTGTDNNTTDNNAATVGPVSCEKADGGVCPQILSHASLGGRSHLFARGNEGGIRYLLVDDMESWSGSGLFLNTQDFGIASQPMTKGWTFDENNDRIDLVVVGTNNKVYWVAKEYNTWGDGLVEIGGNVDSSPVISLVAADQLEVWVLDSRTELLSSKSINTTDGTFSTSEDWIESDIGPMTGNPAIIGRQWGLNESTPETGTHDYVFYNTKGNQTVMVHHRDKGSAKFEGGFVGDPTIYRFESNIDKVQIFGVQINESLKDMVHLTYNADDNTHSNIVNLGGDVTSVPSVISLVEGTMDLVALDSYGKVQHLHYDGANWSEWEDLGMEAQSAPLMINFNDKVSIFAVQESGDLVYARMDVSAAQDSHHWADQLTHMTTPDSNLSLDFYRVRHED